MRVLWVSKHVPLHSQVQELRRLFGQDTTIDNFDKPYASASAIISFFRDNKYDELVIVAPLTVSRSLLNCGIKPLYSQMEQVPENSPLVELTVNNAREQVEGRKRYYRFIRFKRMERLEVVFSELDT